MRRSLFLVAATLFLPSFAAADIPPPAGYVDPCNTDKACGKGQEVNVCSTYYGDSSKCERLHASDGFTFQCRTHGASTWSEVWCRTADAKRDNAKRNEKKVTAPPATDPSAKPAVATPVKAEPAKTPAEVGKTPTEAAPVAAAPVTAKPKRPLRGKKIVRPPAF